MSLSIAIKILVWAAVGVIAAVRPSIGEPFFRQIEKIGQRPAIAWFGFGMLVLLIRGALLPLWPIPKPTIYDEFSYILQADTFAHGRLTNPTHPLWAFFESPYVLQRPTYASKYPPAQSLAMAAGQAMFGDPWFGVWLSCGVMAGALVWALQGWLPAGWALFGGFLALPLAVESYWMNSYWGGAVAAIGGALVIGGYPRVVRQGRIRYALTIAAGFAILANTRPYEGLIFSIPVAIALLARPRAVGLIVALLIPAFAATGFYNRAVTGSALQMPFTEYAQQYAHIPLFNFQALQPARTDLPVSMYDLHQNWEPAEWKKARGMLLLPMRIKDWKLVASTIFGSLLIAMLMVVFLPHLLSDRRIRLPLICVAAALAGSLIEVRYYQHYFAPAVAALLIVAAQTFRHLRQWKLKAQPVGRFLTRAIPVLAIGMVLGARGLIIWHQEPPENLQPINARRDKVAMMLDEFLDKSVILVRYTGHQSPHEEWVYNGANIDDQNVIWAHDLGAAENARLLNYYKGRRIWLFQPDLNYTRLDPYGDKP